MKIETEIFRVYHCRIYITTDARREQLVFTKAVNLAIKQGIDLETFSGCPAAGPYIEATSKSIAKMSAWRKAMANYLRKFTNVTYR